MAQQLLFSKDEEARIVKAIEQAEANTSGEIRVHIEHHPTDNPLERATFWFHKLKMERTKERNGVLFYLSPVSRQFAIVGDKGIHEKVGADFWNDIRDLMVSYFKQGQFAEGLIQGINRTGEKLKTFFPHQDDDTNELSNDISFN